MSADFSDYQEGELYFLPLGGSGEYGGNLNLYQYNGHWLMVDLGISFAGEDMAGVELMLPDPAYIEKQRHRLAGLIITHAHEDHIGGVAHLWKRLRCPIYLTRFAAAFLHAHLNEYSADERPDIRIIEPGQVVNLGPFSWRLVGITHSTPESCMVEINTPAGKVVHTGDWKLDDNPLVGDAYDAAMYQSIGREGVLACVSESTNATVPGRSISEIEVQKGLTQLFARLEGRIAVVVMSRNLGRIRAVAEAAQAVGRNVALVGRSLWKSDQVAREIGYFSDLPDFLSPDDIGYIPRNKLVFICTGSQGEPRAAISRIAAGEHPSVDLERGDSVVFSARIIPGNEVPVGRVQDRLMAGGREVLTRENTEECIYASGHPAVDEITDMYQWLRPQILVPVHGERRFQEANAAIGRNCQIPGIVIPDNGSVIHLKAGAAEIVGNVSTGRLALDGKALVSDQSDAIRLRRKLMLGGSVLATLVIDDRQRLVAPPKLSLRGLSQGEALLDDEAEVKAAIEQAFDKLPAGIRSKDDVLEEAIRLAIRRTVNKIHNKKPVTDIHIVRI